MEGDLEQKLIIALITVTLTTLVNLMFFRLNLNLIDIKKTDEANNRLILFCNYLTTIITNDLIEDSNDFLKLYINDYGFLDNIDTTLIGNYNFLIGVFLFNRSKGYLNDSKRKAEDIEKLDKIKQEIQRVINQKKKSKLHKIYLILMSK